MNKLIKAIKGLDLTGVKSLMEEEPQWVNWSEADGKNALHYLCAVAIEKHPGKVDDSLAMLKLLIKSGMDMDAVHRIPDPGCGFFPATPLWYAYTRGRNENLYKYLLKSGANPNHCMFAIAWYDDVQAAELFKKHGAVIDDSSAGDTPFTAAFKWKKFNVAEWFLQNGANVNFVDAKGNTILFYALKRKYKTEHIQMLLRYGADSTKNKEDMPSK